MTTINKPIAVEVTTKDSASLKKAKKKSKKTKEKDVFMDTPLRCVGFLDEVGESLRPVLSASSNPLIKSLPNIAYIPATAFVVGDVAHKYKKTKEEEGTKKALLFAGREAAYQGIVSIAAPMLVAKGVNKASQKFAGKLMDKVPGFLKKVFSLGKDKMAQGVTTSKILTKAGLPAKIVGAGISIFALTKLAKPIDKLTSMVFKTTVDPLLGLNKKEDKTVKQSYEKPIAKVINVEIPEDSDYKKKFEINKSVKKLTK